MAAQTRLIMHERIQALVGPLKAQLKEAEEEAQAEIAAALQQEAHQAEQEGHVDEAIAGGAPEQKADD